MSQNQHRKLQPLAHKDALGPRQAALALLRFVDFRDSHGDEVPGPKVPCPKSEHPLGLQPDYMTWNLGLGTWDSVSIHRRIGHTRLGKASLPQADTSRTGHTPCRARRDRSNCASERIVDTQLHAAADDLGFGQMHQRGMDSERKLPLHSRLGRQVGQSLKRLDELRPAIGIAAVVDRVDADKDVGRDRSLRHRPAPATKIPCCGPAHT